RLGDDAAHALLQPGRRVGEAGEAVIPDGEIELEDAAAAEETRDQRVAERLEALFHVGQLVEIADAQLDRLALYREPGIADARFLQEGLADVADQRLQALLNVILAVDFIEQIGPSLEVEAEHHLLVEARPILDHVLRKKIRK